MEGKQESINPTAIPLPQAAKLLSALARRAIRQEWLEKDIANGAPANADGTINLLNYAAWLVKEMGRGD